MNSNPTLRRIRRIASGTLMAAAVAVGGISTALASASGHPAHRAAPVAHPRPVGAATVGPMGRTRAIAAQAPPPAPKADLVARPRQAGFGGGADSTVPAAPPRPVPMAEGPIVESDDPGVPQRLPRQVDEGWAATAPVRTARVAPHAHTAAT